MCLLLICASHDETNCENNGQIDILLNTAGILDDYRPSLETSEALWDQILATNLKVSFSDQCSITLFPPTKKE